MSESDLQKAVASYLDDLAERGRLYWFHCPNSIRTSYSQAKAHKAYGMKAGVPDCVIMLPDGKTLFIELKTKVGALQPSQKDAHAKLIALGHRVHVVRADNAFEAKILVGNILKSAGVV